MGPLLLLLALVLSGLDLCNGQESLTVTFHMNGINGTAAFSLQNRTLTVRINLSGSLGSGTSTVEIRPIWVDYDVTDKCSTTQLGEVMPGFSATVTFSSNTAEATFQNVVSLFSLGGSSIVVKGTSKTVCASIESEEISHPTAVAQFQSIVQGTVYFRQSISDQYTHIVSDLFSGQRYNGSWLISDSAANCSLITTVSNVQEFNPKSASGSNCSKASPESCAIGHLSGKLGDISVGANKADMRLAYTDRNLPSITDIDGKLLLIKTPDGSYACANIQVFYQRKAIVEFNHEGVTGSVLFYQPNPFDFTKTEVHLKGLNYSAKGYHVHLWPTPTKIVNGQDLCGPTVVSGHFNPYNKNVTDPSYPAPDASTDDMYEVGDLSFKYGTLENLTGTSFVQVYEDWNLPLFGHNSIIGRSLVIHRNDANASRWVCANIQSVDPISMAAIAVFKYPLIGHITFIQGENQLETSIFAQLDYNDGRPGTKNHIWQINSNMTGNDSLATDELQRCLSTGSIYNPLNIVQENQYIEYCQKNFPLGCKLGDMSGKLGPLTIRNTATSDTSSKQFFTDVNLPLSGGYSIIGKSVVIMNERGTSILACATIQPLHDQSLQASFNSGSITGTITFNQKAGFGARKTMVTNMLNGQRSNNRFWIYEFAPKYDKNDCTNLGGVFNPLNITTNASLGATDDMYRVGDILRDPLQTSWEHFNLPLTGLTSISQRSLVIVDQANNSKVVACAKIATFGQTYISQNVEAVSTFTGPVSGEIHLFQTVYADGTMSDTSIFVNLTQVGQQSLHHNWHTHLNPIQGDANAEQSRCNSAGGHFNPYMADTNQSNYVAECRPDNPLRCELGDQASKLSTYDVGKGPKMFTDVDLPLAGKYSVQGRSMVLHVSERGAARLACADIIPVTPDAISFKIKSSSSLDKRNIARVYAEVIKADLTDVVVELIPESQGISEVRVHFLGFQRDSIRKNFKDIVYGRDTHILNPYAPYSVGAANYLMLSTTLLLTVFAVQVLNYF